MSVADIARGAYARSPLWARSLVGRALSGLPPAVLYGRAYCDLVKRIGRASVDEAYGAEERRRVLREILMGASHARAYMAALEDFDLEKDDPLEVLSALPLLTREDVARDRTGYISCNASKMDLVTTGATGGTPLSFFLDRDRSPREWAFVTSIWSTVGFTLGDSRAVLRGTSIGSAQRGWHWDPALRELSLSPFELTDEAMSQYLELIGTYRIQWLHGYPSAVCSLCAFGQRVNWRPPASLKGVLPISEALYPHQRELIHHVLPGRAVLPFYGQSERVAIAGEVPEATGTYRFQPLYGVTELVQDNGDPVVVAGRRGRLVGTGFISRGMPLLRYDTGDTAELVELPNRSNCHQLMVRALWGRRRQEYLVGREGNPIAITGIGIHTSAYRAVRQFQFFQDTPGVVALRVAPLTPGDTAAAESLARQFQTKIPRSVEFHLEITDEIAPTVRGKRTFIDQRIDVPNYGVAPFPLIPGN